MKRITAADHVAARWGVDPERVRRLYAQNAAQLRQCAAKAAAHPTGTYRGYTAAQWSGFAQHAEQAARIA